ncbi:MAG: NAD(P)H-dependent oxidoreductase [Eubacteriaceae bacterium]|jgi:multimeric flavodoxin WrbA|nr:NAD(P)H-dependent oxidoreductase [Eubacteriaceae bacterium]
MAIYILESSSRKTGYSAQAAQAAISIFEAQGAAYIYDRAISLNVAYCLACDKCISEEVECSVKDDMLGVYANLIKASALLFITPITFSSVPAQLKAILDRGQRFYNRPLKREAKIPAYFIAFGGAKPYKEQFEIYPLQFKHLLKNIDAWQAGALNFAHTDAYGPRLSDAAARQIQALALQAAGS